MSSAKKLRLSRLRDPVSKKYLIVPLDHGLTMGSLPGIQNVEAMTGWLGHSGIDAIIAHKGVCERLIDADVVGGKGLILHLNGMPTIAENPDRKAMLANVQTAQRLGVDGVSIQVNFQGHNDRENLAMLGAVTDEAGQYGLAVLTMLYDMAPIGKKSEGTKRMRHLSRIAMELGTDILKIGLLENRYELGEVLQEICNDIQVLIAGGSMVGTSELLSRLSRALWLGANGICVGRNVFSNEDPLATLTILDELVHGDTPGNVIDLNRDGFRHGHH